MSGRGLPSLSASLDVGGRLRMACDIGMTAIVKFCFFYQGKLQHCGLGDTFPA